MSQPTPQQALAVLVAQARAKDPGLPPETADLLARTAAEHLGEVGGDAPELARRLMAAHPHAGATAANVVARAAVEMTAGEPG